jgi:alpha-1,2-mannosyltransferase
MADILKSMQSGAWVTRERMRIVALAVVAAFAIGFGYLVATADGYVDRQGRPIGTDFSNVYAAGTFVVEGRPQAPFDPALQHEREQAIFGADTPFYGWHYPPFFLFIAGVLALMPYGLALAVWQAVTFALYLLSIRAILSCGLAGGMTTLRGQLWLLLAIGFPAVFVNLGHGHNGFLTAALLGSALLVLDHRPVVAGVLFGLIAYKPQFGLMIPLALASTGRWRTIAAAITTVALLGLATTVAFGPQVWDAFLASTRFTRVVVLETGDTGWHKIQSVFSWVRMWGGTVATAYAVQAALAVVLGAALARAARRPHYC